MTAATESPSTNDILGASALRAANARDALGRVTEYYELGTGGAYDVVFNRNSIVYDVASRVISDSVTQKRLEGSVSYTYTTATGQQLRRPARRALLQSTTTARRVTGPPPQPAAAARPPIISSCGTTPGSRARPTPTPELSGTSTYAYDGVGRVASVGITGTRAAPSPSPTRRPARF